MGESLQTVAAAIEVPSFDRAGIAHFIWRKLIVLIQGLITWVGLACYAELFFILIYMTRAFPEPPYPLWSWQISHPDSFSTQPLTPRHI